MTLKSLEKLPVAECPQFLHRVVDGICGRSRPHMADYGNRWSVAEWTELLDTLSVLFRFAVGRKCSEEEVKESLLDLDSSYSDIILACLRARHDEIRMALVERTNCVSSAQLQDFDWQLKLALSSDKIASLQMPLLNLSLDVKESGMLKPVSMEMNREELQMLISSLEAANKFGEARFLLQYAQLRAMSFCPTSVPNITNTLVAEWAQILIAMLQNLMESLPRRRRLL